MVGTQYKRQTCVWQYNNIIEFKQSTFDEYLQQQVIHHQTSYTYTPQQNGLTKRKNRQIMEIFCASFFVMNMLTI